VPTDVVSILTTPAAPSAPPGSVIRDALSTNAKKKETESVTTPDGRLFTREVNNVNFKCQARNHETSMLTAGSLQLMKAQMADLPAATWGVLK
jgi:hypothetical protein